MAKRESEPKRAYLTLAMDPDDKAALKWLSENFKKPMCDFIDEMGTNKAVEAARRMRDQAGASTAA